MLDSIPNTNEFLQLEIDKTRLLIPQEQVSSIESVMDIQSRASDTFSVGTVMNDGHLYEVFDFDAEIHPNNSMSDSRKMCVCVNDGEVAFAIACDSISRLNRNEVKLFKLPVCMQTGSCPVSYIGIRKERIYNLISIRALNQLVEHPGKQYKAQGHDSVAECTEV